MKARALFVIILFTVALACSMGRCLQTDTEDQPIQAEDYPAHFTTPS
jgi:hypothetical protein